MSFQQHLENLRAKPDHVRRHYAFWSSFGLTVVIFAFWVGSFTTFGSSTHSVVATAVKNAGSPGQTLVASVGSFFGDLRDLVFGPSKVTYTSVIVTPGKN